MSRAWIGLLFLAASARAAEVNPHGSPTGCIECHATAADGVSIGEPLPIVATCRGCHPTADMHPVGMKPDQVHVAAKWPLENGEVTCATCHAEPAHGGDAANLSPPWHRGGPYASVEQLCYQCHDRATYTRKDPHHPTTAGAAGDPTCSACHMTPPAPGARVEDAELRAGVENACGECHPGPIHLGQADHMGKQVAEADRARVSAVLPLTADGKIGCWTCHDVHTEAPAAVDGHYRGERPLATQLVQQALADDWKLVVPTTGLRLPGNAPAEHPDMLALPSADGSLCRTCHTELP